MNKNLQSELEELAHVANATSLLKMRGWKPLGNWCFESPIGIVHDLSAADLGQLTRIEREGLFQVH